MAESVSEELFGYTELFRARGYSVPDDYFDNSGCTDHELVTHRLNWLIENSEVVG